jgi:hypothetical protein
MKPWGFFLGLVGVMALTATSAAAFLPHQSLWLDETTQLAGLSLGPVRVVSWLTNPASMDLGFTGDRMPPLSYWAGWAWSQIFGSGEVSLRWFGVVCASLASGIIFFAAARAFGTTAAFLTGALFALSPNVCYYAVEIRAYPLFLLTSAGALASFLAIVQSNGKGAARWVSLTIWLLLSMYTHFYGVVLAGTLLCTLFVLGWTQFGRMRPVLLCTFVLACCAVGLLPFVSGAASLSKTTNTAAALRDRWREVAQTVYRLIGHPATQVYSVALIGTVLSAGSLLLGGFFVRGQDRLPVRALQFALALGLGVTAVTNFLLVGFVAAKYPYSCWALPALFILLGAGVRAGPRIVRAGAFACGLLLLGGEAMGTSQLWVRGDCYAHTSFQKVEAILASLPEKGTAVVHEGAPYALLYYPIHYAHETRLTQYVVANPGEPVLGGNSLDIHSRDFATPLTRFQYLVVLRSAKQEAGDIALSIRSGTDSFDFGPTVRLLEASGAWRRIGQDRFMSFVSAEMILLERGESSPAEQGRAQEELSSIGPK